MLKLGDKVWVFDGNRRRYNQVDGRSSGPAIYAEHFVEQRITGETSRSWIVNGVKYPKSDPSALCTHEQKEDAIWVNEHRYKIIQMAERCRDAATLRKIAQIVGYVEK